MDTLPTWKKIKNKIFQAFQQRIRCGKGEKQ